MSNLRLGVRCRGRRCPSSSFLLHKHKYDPRPAEKLRCDLPLASVEITVRGQREISVWLQYVAGSSGVSESSNNFRFQILGFKRKLQVL